MPVDASGNQSVGLGSYLKLEGTWKAFHVPAAAAAASASQVAGAAGVKNVLLGCVLNFVGVAAQSAVLYFTLRDGLTGAGTILCQWSVPIAAGAATAPWSVNLSGMYVPGTAATAMTLETTNAAGAALAPSASNLASILIWGNTEV